MAQDWEVWRERVEPVLTSLKEEWQFYGYDDVTEDDVWKTFLTKMRREKEIREPVRLHWIVNRLYSLRAGDYMTQLTVQSYRDSGNSGLPPIEDLTPPGTGTD
ncbi:post-transcriptional regulator [Alkalicoccus urumqiensis]|uniref:Post-transcriptional regulator n=1 Tax=Alkalicoccus urumqiensis TaxID=1548213 RepID=A0A2P6MFF7_ALKUR|nr:post-transcriptional regulator [Alkalicoccus urumqiensis]PRO65008.1 hypothetical protein C6I21_11190 [Alkalicoccus urumqiensis]